MSIVDLVTIQKLSPDVRQRAKQGEIVYLFDDQKPSWSRPGPFYLFSCINEDCINHERLAIDYAHGFPNHNRRVICPLCDQKKYFPIIPMTLWQKIKFILWLKKLFRAEKMVMLERKK